MEKALHMVGKPARKMLIRYALSKYKASELASMLGLSKAAISKYTSGATHPSDQVLLKLIEMVDDELKSRILERIAGELSDALVELIKEYEKLVGKTEATKLRTQVCMIICGEQE